jgi:hypothetical protein
MARPAVSAVGFALGLALVACGGGGSGGVGDEGGHGGRPGGGRASAGGEESAERGVEITVAFRTAATEEGPDGLAPRTTVELVLLRHGAQGPEVVPLLDVEGVCQHRGGEGGVLLRLACWWAGAGDVLDVVRRADTLVVTRQQEDEGLDQPLPLEELRRIALPAGARVRPLAPETLR